MSAEPLVVRPLGDRIADLHRPRLGNRGAMWPADPLARFGVRAALATPFLVAAVLLVAGGPLADTPNMPFASRAAAIPWDRADPAWIGGLYPPISTVLAAIVPGGPIGMTILGALFAGVLLHALIEGMRQRGLALSTTIVLTVALAVNPLFVFVATENLPAFLGIGFLGLGFADLVRFTTERNTQSGFRAGILLMLAALSDPSGIVYVVVATAAAPLLTAGRRRAKGHGFANTLVVLFPTACAFGGVFLLEWIFAGDPLRLLGSIVSIDPARLGIFPALVTTPLGWLWLATVAGTWAIGLVVRRPGAVLVTLMLFAAIIGGYQLGLVPQTAAGTIYLMMMLVVVAIVPPASNGRLTLAVNLLALLELAVAWASAANRPIVVEWMAVLVQPLLH